MLLIENELYDTQVLAFTDNGKAGWSLQYIGHSYIDNIPPTSSSLISKILCLPSGAHGYLPYASLNRKQTKTNFLPYFLRVPRSIFLNLPTSSADPSLSPGLNSLSTDFHKSYTVPNN